jgi:hypothetical protein
MNKKNIGIGFKKYPNGFMPKIAYWTSELKDEVSNTKAPDIGRIVKIQSKLDYFIQREYDRTLEKRF